MIDRLLPELSPEGTAPQTESALPLYWDVRWDAKKNIPAWVGGTPMIVSGLAAVEGWICRTLQVVRQSSDVFSADYGCDITSLVGQPLSQEVRSSEAIRLVRECLMINPYILGVTQIAIDLTGSVCRITCSINTVYGEVSYGNI